MFDSTHTNIHEILQDFNGLHPKLQFTAETEKDHTLNYLDSTMLRKPAGINEPTPCSRIHEHENWYKHQNGIQISLYSRRISEKLGKTKLRNGTKVKQNRQCTYNTTLRCFHIIVMALAILHANHIFFYAPYSIYICGLYGSIIFFALPHKCNNFQGKKCTTEYKM